MLIFPFMLLTANMYNFQSEFVNDQILKYKYFNGEEPLTYRQLIDGLLQNSSDSKQLVSVLTDSLADANGKTIKLLLGKCASCFLYIINYVNNSNALPSKPKNWVSLLR